MEKITQDVYIVVYKYYKNDFISAYSDIKSAKRYYDPDTQKIFKTTIVIDEIDVENISNEEIE